LEIKLVMSRERAIVLYRALEIIARIGMLQFKDMLELLDPKISWDEAEEIEQFLKRRLSVLNKNAYYSISSKDVPEESHVAWEAYQHLRREIAWYDKGKDWRTDERVWTGPDSMVTVNFDEPMKMSATPGEFKTERVNDGVV